MNCEGARSQGRGSWKLEETRRGFSLEPQEEPALPTPDFSPGRLTAGF